MTLTGRTILEGLGDNDYVQQCAAIPHDQKERFVRDVRDPHDPRELIRMYVNQIVVVRKLAREHIGDVTLFVMQYLVYRGIMPEFGGDRTVRRTIPEAWLSESFELCEQAGDRYVYVNDRTDNPTIPFPTDRDAMMRLFRNVSISFATKVFDPYAIERIAIYTPYTHLYTRSAQFADTAWEYNGVVRMTLPQITGIVAREFVRRVDDSNNSDESDESLRTIGIVTSVAPHDLTPHMISEIQRVLRIKATWTKCGFTDYGSFVFNHAAEYNNRTIEFRPCYMFERCDTSKPSKPSKPA